MANINPVTGEPYPSVSQAELDQHTVQALIELVYVRTANDILGNSLASLQSALQATKSVIGILNQIQNLHNQVKVMSKSAFSFHYRSAAVTGVSSAGTVTVNASLYAQEYNAAASAYFGKAISPQFIFSSSGATVGTASGTQTYQQFQDALKTLKTQLGKEISVIARLTPISAGTTNSLFSTITKVYNDIPATLNYSTVSKWVLDKYNVRGSAVAASAGQIQNDITFAITASQNLNDSQQESVRRYLFIFQQYYQSASSVLTGINTLINEMAQKISNQ